MAEGINVSVCERDFISIPISLKTNIAATNTAVRQPDIGNIYEIFAEEILGSGQFGTVFGGTSLLKLTSGSLARFAMRSRCTVDIIT